MPAYKAKWIDKAIQSILSQTYTNIELVIVNDQSPEGIESIVETYDDERIIYYKNEKNIGGESLVKQWTHCLPFAQGDYVVIAADDDIYAANFAEECLTLAHKYPQSDIIRARCGIIDENGTLRGIDNYFPEYMSQIEYTYNYRMGQPFICMGNFLFKTQTLKKNGFIDFPKALGSDVTTSIEMARNGMACTTDILFYFRQSDIHISGSMNDPHKRTEAITKLFDWLIHYNYLAPTSEIEKLYLQHLTESDWIEKRNFDYYNQIIRKMPLSYILNSNIKDITTKLKIKYFLKRILDNYNQ